MFADKENEEEINDLFLFPFDIDNDFIQKNLDSFFDDINDEESFFINETKNNENLSQDSNMKEMMKEKTDFHNQIKNIFELDNSDCIFNDSKMINIDIYEKISQKYSSTKEEFSNYNQVFINPFANCSKLYDYINELIFYGYFKKLTKEFKIIIYNQISKYWKQFYPKLIQKELRPLNRNEKRSITFLDKRLFSIGGYIYKALESDDKMNIIISIKKDVCSIITEKNTKKNISFLKEENKYISKWEEYHA